MALDYPDFTIPQWSRRDWAAKELSYKTWCYTSPTVGADKYLSHNVYTVPSGKILFITDIHFGGNIRGTMWLRVVDGLSFVYDFFEPYDTKITNLTLPLPALAGETIRYTGQNTDIIPGLFRYVFSGWEGAASTPEKPRNDDPEELYRTGEFNFCQIISLPNNEQVFIFGKAKEKVKHFLKVKNYGLKSQIQIPSEIEAIVDFE